MNNAVLITGGTSGIGRAIAEAFLAAGSHVTCTGKTPGEIHTLVVDQGVDEMITLLLVEL